MATTATEILARVQALGYGSDTESSQLLALNMQHKRLIGTRRWKFLVGQDSSKTLTVGNGTLAYDSVAEQRRIDAIRLELSTTYVDLEHKDYEDFRSLEHTLRETGVPEYWTQEGTDIHFWPAPDQAYKVVIDYVARPTAITAGGTAVQIPDSHADILVWSVIIPITFRERDWEAHNFARQMYSELYAEMLAQYGMTDRQTPKRVAQSGFYDNYECENPWLLG